MGRWTRFALILLVVGFAASEIGLRIFLGENSHWNVLLGAHKVYDPVTMFRNKPHYELVPGLVTNELGYLAPDHLATAAPADALRLIYLGDSNTATPFEGNYPSQVEGLLRQQGIAVQTVNAAVTGFTSDMARALFETELSHFDGDYFFLYLGWNDLFHYSPESLPLPRKERQGYPLNPVQRFLTHIYTLRLVYAAQVVIDKRRPAFDRPLDEHEHALYDGYRPEHFYTNLRAILELAKQRYPHVYMMTMMTMVNDHPTPEQLMRIHFPKGMDENIRKLAILVAKYNEAIRTVAAEENVPLLDFFTLFDTPEHRALMVDSCHVNPAGAAVEAQMVADAVLAQEHAAPTRVVQR